MTWGEAAMNTAQAISNETEKWRERGGHGRQVLLASGARCWSAVINFCVAVLVFSVTEREVDEETRKQQLLMQWRLERKDKNKGSVRWTFG